MKDVEMKVNSLESNTYGKGMQKVVRYGAKSYVKQLERDM